MYKDQHKWLRFALILWDCLIAISAFTFAGIWRFRGFFGFLEATDVEKLCVVTLLASLLAFTLSKMYQKFVIRGYFQEILYVLRSNFWVVVFLLLYIFSTKNDMELSRLTLLYFLPINIILQYSSHCAIKSSCRQYASGRRGWKLLIITDSENAALTCRNVYENNGWKNKSVEVIFIDGKTAEFTDLVGFTFLDSQVDCIEYAKHNPFDEVLISVNRERFITSGINEIVEELANMGIVVSFKLQFPSVEGMPIAEITKLSNIYIASFVNREYNFLEIIAKRIMDIFGSLVGLLITFIVGIFITPVILIESPGPLLFKQKRIGRNGRVFTIYKFRSMYKDAEARKSELMKKNKMKGLLFKVDEDPRITRVGKFIRKTSIDELPQFFNVLIGDMSLVGTRPPTLDEYNQYSSYYKKRLSFRPGITGIWQTSGRNDVTNFDEVMEMDLQYIQEWSILLDIKLLLKTIVVVVTGRGAE